MAASGRKEAERNAVEEAVRGSGARAGLAWRSAAGKTAFRLISQDLKEVRQV